MAEQLARGKLLWDTRNQILESLSVRKLPIWEFQHIRILLCSWNYRFGKPIFVVSFHHELTKAPFSFFTTLFTRIWIIVQCLIDIGLYEVGEWRLILARMVAWYRQTPISRILLVNFYCCGLVLWFHRFCLIADLLGCCLVRGEVETHDVWMKVVHVVKDGFPERFLVINDDR